MIKSIILCLFLACIGLGCVSSASINECDEAQAENCKKMGGTGKWKYSFHRYLCEMPDGSAKESFPPFHYCHQVSSYEHE